MSGKVISRGVYDAHEVAHLLGLRSVDQIVRWSTKDSKGRPAIVAPTHARAFAFVDLVSLAVVAEAHVRGVVDEQIRQAVRFLEVEFSHERPLTHREVLEILATSGSAFVARLDGGWSDIGRGGQRAFDPIVELYLKTLSYDDVGVAAIWRPSPHVVLDPRIQAGAACVAGTRIPTTTIADLLEDQDPEQIAQEYGLTLEQVLAAERFEQRLDDGIGLAT